MNKILENIQGDKTLWAVLLLLAGFSFLPVYSAASNLAYVSGGGNTIGFLGQFPLRNCANQILIDQLFLQ